MARWCNCFHSTTCYHHDETWYRHRCTLHLDLQLCIHRHTSTSHIPGSHPYFDCCVGERGGEGTAALLPTCYLQVEAFIEFCSSFCPLVVLLSVSLFFISMLSYLLSRLFFIFLFSPFFVFLFPFFFTLFCQFFFLFVLPFFLSSSFVLSLKGLWYS